ncbi:MAG: hypothetical protein M3P18_09145, partial [Actinomycetota bacterium]|nr:hypothetical protein [Actinomycetota bacterium]
VWVVKAANLERLGTIAVYREDRLAQLYRLHASGGLRLAFVLTREGPPCSEDITQEAFVRLARRWSPSRTLIMPVPICSG